MCINSNHPLVANIFEGNRCANALAGYGGKRHRASLIINESIKTCFGTYFETLASQCVMSCGKRASFLARHAVSLTRRTQRNFWIVSSCMWQVSSAGLLRSNTFKDMFFARSYERITAGADLRRLIPTLTPTRPSRTSSSFKFEISESGSRAGVLLRRRVSRGDMHSTRAGSMIGSPAYVGRFESSTYVGRLRAPSLMTNFGVSP